MVAAVQQHDAVLALPEPKRLPNGSQPEARVVVCGVSWASYLDFDRQLGEDRPGPRFYYLDGELEIMTTSLEHERISEWIGLLLEKYCEHEEIEIFLHGQATMRSRLQKAGAEPDKSWCVHKDKKVPDLVLEIALTSGGIPKLDIYQRLKVPEVWIWRKDRLEAYGLASTNRYERLSESGVFPRFDFDVIAKCLSQASWSAARKFFRAHLHSGTDR
jgi:Uma2 family endonuclease